jgi:DNA-binding response OmpR family regulator
MTIAWVTTRTEPLLNEAFHAAHRQIKIFTPDEFLAAGLSWPGDIGGIVFELSDSGLLDLCRDICCKKIAPMLAIVPNLAYAQAALEIGVYDFLVEPIDPLEASLRMHRLARVSTLVRVGDLEIDLVAWRLSSGGRRIRLSPVEFRLLACLAKRVGEMVSHATILEEVWRWEAEHGTLAQVKNYIGRVRRKIEPDLHHPQYIISIPGEGYRLRNHRQWEENRRNTEISAAMTEATKRGQIDSEFMFVVGLYFGSLLV